MIDYDLIYNTAIKLKDNNRDNLIEFQKLVNRYRKDDENKLYYSIEHILKLERDMLYIIKKTNPEFIMCMDKDSTSVSSPRNPWYGIYTKLKFYNAYKIEKSNNTFILLGFTSDSNSSDNDTLFFCNSEFYEISRLFITIIGPDKNKYTMSDLDNLWKEFKLKYSYKPITMVNWLNDGYELNVLRKTYSDNYIKKVFGRIRTKNKLDRINING